MRVQWGSRKRGDEDLVDDVVELDLQAGVVAGVGSARVHLPEVHHGVSIAVDRIAVGEHPEAGTAVCVGGGANFDITIRRGARRANGGPSIDDRYAERTEPLFVLEVETDLDELRRLHLGGHLQHARVGRGTLTDGGDKRPHRITGTVPGTVAGTDLTVPVPLGVEPALGPANLVAPGGAEEDEGGDEGDDEGLEGIAGHGCLLLCSLGRVVEGTRRGFTDVVHLRFYSTVEKG